MKALRKLTLQTRILLGFAISFIVLGVLGLYNAATLQATTQSASQIVERYLPFNDALRQFKIDELEVLASVVEVALLQISQPDSDMIPEEMEQAEEALSSANATLDLIARYSDQFFPDLRSAIEELRTEHAEYVNLGDELIALTARDLDSEEFEEVKEAYEDVERRILEMIDGILTEQSAAVAQFNAAFIDTTVTATTITISILVLVLVLSVLIAVFGSRAIVRPLRDLDAAARDIARGDYSRRVVIESEDEVGSLAQSFNLMSEAIETRQKQLNEQLEEVQRARNEAERANQVKSAFLASMSHELRTPLNAVINFTRFVVDGDTGPVNDQQRELLNDVIASAKHLLSLINDVLDMSKIEAGSLNLFLVDGVDIEALIRQAVATGQGLLGDKPVQIHVDVDPQIPPLRADKQRIYQILLNIISNACKFTDQGTINVRARHLGERIEIAVADTGPGIAPEDQELVFSAFKQTETGLRQQSGTGLGMPIARSLAEAHGGRLWLESELGKGSTFYVELPVQISEMAPTMA